ncbi:MAG: hypothetical protein H8E74_02790 [Gammaproteobacteria bacterium]|nr:hypothetical protein [Gammaproteobacteria bacterium]
MEFFRIMPCRYQTFENTIEAYAQTGIPMVAYKDDCTFHNTESLVDYGPACFADDPGACYFIPKLVEIFGISLDTAIQLLYSGSVFLAFLAGAIASFYYCETRFGKAISVIAIGILSFIIAVIGDLYVFLGSIPLALIPCWLCIQKFEKIKYIIPYFLLSGLIIAFGHLIRSHSGTSTLIFLCLSLLLFSNNIPKKIKTFSIIGLFTSMLFVFLSFDIVMQQRIEFLSSIGSPLELSGFRILWHNAYYSLGYLWNNFGYGQWPGHEPSDTYSLFKVLSINPDIVLFSKEYESILRDAYFEFVKEHPFFFIQTLFAKFGVLLMYFFIFANIGLVLAFFYPQKFKFYILFTIAIVFNMSFGLLALPNHVNLLGLFAFSTLFNVYSIDYAVREGLFN